VFAVSIIIALMMEAAEDSYPNLKLHLRLGLPGVCFHSEYFD
jgi:hypothetical protein